MAAPAPSLSSRVERARPYGALVLLTALVLAVLVYPSPSHHPPQPSGQASGQAAVSAAAAKRAFLAAPNVSGWLKRYTRPVTRVRRERGGYAVSSYVPSQEVARGFVDLQGHVVSAWTGPQVLWTMARPAPDFGGARGRRLALWLALSLVFAVLLAGRLRSWRSLDLLALVSFAASWDLWLKGHLFWSVSLVYPPLLYLLGRLILSGLVPSGPRPGSPQASRRWPTAALLTAVSLLALLHLYLGLFDGQVIDVGQAGAQGAEAILHGHSPYGLSGIRHLDTYGPLDYLASLPATLAVGPGTVTLLGHAFPDLAARLTTLLFDGLAAFGLYRVGRRGSRERGLLLAAAWLSFPVTAWTVDLSANDVVLAAALVWGLYLFSRPLERGLLLGLAAWVKLVPLALVPLWLAGRSARRLGREQALVILGLLLATTSLALVLLGGRPFAASFDVFASRSFGYQLHRHSPFSLWDWGAYQARGLPDLKRLQGYLEAALVLGVLALAVRPRRRSLRQVAALSGALLCALELVATHWYHPYLLWILPFFLLGPLGLLPAPEGEPLWEEPAGLGLSGLPERLPEPMGG